MDTTGTINQGCADLIELLELYMSNPIIKEIING